MKDYQVGIISDVAQTWEPVRAHNVLDALHRWANDALNDPNYIGRMEDSLTKGSVTLGVRVKPNEH